jgi:ankyrin repeat protein
MNAKEVVIGGIAAGALALGVACGGASEFTSSPVPDRNDGRVAEAPVRTRATPLSTDSPAPTAVSDPMARPLATPTSAPTSTAFLTPTTGPGPTPTAFQRKHGFWSQSSVGQVREKRPDKSDLHWAAAFAAPAVVEFLLDQGADTEARIEKKDKRFPADKRFPFVSGSTPLHLAVRYNDDPAVVKLLLDWGASIKKRDARKYQPLSVAAKYNEDPAVVKLLLDAGADLNTTPDSAGISDKRRKERAKRFPSGYSSLHLAARYNPGPGVVKILLDRGGHILSKTRHSKRTPLQLGARYNEEMAVVKILLDAYVDFHSKCEADARSEAEPQARSEAESFSMSEARTNRAVRHLVNKAVQGKCGNALLSLRDYLYLAARFNQETAVVKILLDRYLDIHPGCEAEVKGVAGPLDMSEVEIRDEVNSMCGGDTLDILGKALHLAARETQEPAVVALLLDYGADIHQRGTGYADNTVLHAAVYNEEPAIAAFLLDRGADKTVKNRDGQTPCQLARKTGSLKDIQVIGRLCKP